MAQADPDKSAGIRAVRLNDGLELTLSNLRKPLNNGICQRGIHNLWRGVVLHIADPRSSKGSAAFTITFLNTLYYSPQQCLLIQYLMDARPLPWQPLAHGISSMLLDQRHLKHVMARPGNARRYEKLPLT